MVEAVAGWQTVGSWVTRSVAQALPARLVKLRWSESRLLSRIELFHFSQGPQFQVRSHIVNPELSGGGFNLFNFSPFAFSIVALDLRLSVGSREFSKYKLRLPEEIPVQPQSRSGFLYEWPLTGPALTYVQQYSRDDLWLRIQGHLIIKSSVFGELKKDVHGDVLADIDRDQHPQLAASKATR